MIFLEEFLLPHILGQSKLLNTIAIWKSCTILWLWLKWGPLTLQNNYGSHVKGVSLGTNGPRKRFPDGPFTRIQFAIDIFCNNIWGYRDWNYSSVLDHTLLPSSQCVIQSLTTRFSRCHDQISSIFPSPLGDRIRCFQRNVPESQFNLFWYWLFWYNIKSHGFSSRETVVGPLSGMLNESKGDIYVSRQAQDITLISDMKYRSCVLWSLWDWLPRNPSRKLVRRLGHWKSWTVDNKMRSQVKISSIPLIVGAVRLIGNGWEGISIPPEHSNQFLSSKSTEGSLINLYQTDMEPPGTDASICVTFPLLFFEKVRIASGGSRISWKSDIYSAWPCRKQGT